MDTKQILNAMAYPASGQNVRTKDFILYSVQSIASGQNNYPFFQDNLTNIFQRNIKLPQSNSNIFFIEGISMHVPTSINTEALTTSLSNILQQSYLEISINSRVILNIPGLDFIQYLLTINADATPEILFSRFNRNIRKLPYPIMVNGNANISVTWYCNTTGSTDFDGIDFRLNLHVKMFDKLQDFNYDELQNNQFQKINVSLFDTQQVTTANATTYDLFADNTKVKTLINKVFPLSDIETVSIQNIEVFIGQPTTGVTIATVFNDRIQNQLVFNLDDVNYYQSDLQNKLSVLTGIEGDLTTAGADTIAYASIQDIRQSQLLKIPLNIPSNSKVVMQLLQPASSEAVGSYITTVLRGISTRRVA